MYNLMINYRNIIINDIPQLTNKKHTKKHYNEYMQCSNTTTQCKLIYMFSSIYNIVIHCVHLLDNKYRAKAIYLLYFMRI